MGLWEGSFIPQGVIRPLCLKHFWFPSAHSRQRSWSRCSAGYIRDGLADVPEVQHCFLQQPVSKRVLNLGNKPPVSFSEKCSMLVLQLCQQQHHQELVTDAQAPSWAYRINTWAELCLLLQQLPRGP